MCGVFFARDESGNFLPSVPKLRVSPRKFFLRVANENENEKSYRVCESINSNAVKGYCIYFD